MLKNKILISRIYFFLFIIIGVLSFSSSCNKEEISEEQLINTIYYDTNEVFINEFGVAKYFGKKLTLIDFGEELSLQFTDAEANSIPQGEYIYGRIEKGFRIYLNCNDEIIKAKTGTLNVTIKSEDPKIYNFEINAQTFKYLDIKGNIEKTVSFENNTNSFIYKDKIYKIEEAFGVHQYTGGTFAFDYIYFLSKKNDPSQPYVGVIFFGAFSGSLNEGNYAWGGEFDGIIYDGERYVNASNGNLYVSMTDENSEFGVYDVFFAMTCEESLKGEYKGTIPVYDVKDFNKKFHNEFNNPLKSQNYLEAKIKY